MKRLEKILIILTNQIALIKPPNYQYELIVYLFVVNAIYFAQVNMQVSDIPKSMFYLIRKNSKTSMRWFPNLKSTIYRNLTKIKR